MDIFKTFVLDGSSHDVAIVYDHATPFFRASDVGKVIGINNISKATKLFDADERVVRSVTTAGGHQDCLFLTEPGVYRLLMRSNKPLARPFQKWVCSVLTEIREKGMYDLQQEIDRLRRKHTEELAAALSGSAVGEDAAGEALQELAGENAVLRKYRDDVEAEHHRRLIEVHDNTPLVYVGRIRLRGQQQLIKIGSTASMSRRAAELVQHFGSFTLLRVFPCDDNVKFERFLQQHKHVKPLRFDEDVVPGTKFIEVYHMNSDQLARLMNVASRNVKEFYEGSGSNGVKRMSALLESILKPASVRQPPSVHHEGNAAPPEEDTMEPVVKHLRPLRWKGPSEAVQGSSAVMKAAAILSHESARPYDLVCAVAMATGLMTQEIMKGTLVEVAGGRGFRATMSGGVLAARSRKRSADYEICLLLPFRLVDAAMRRIHAFYPCANLTTTQVNLKHSGGVNAAARRFLGSPTATFSRVRDAYMKVFTPHDYASSNKKSRRT
jgi:prophage antirepressor-like protein